MTLKRHEACVKITRKTMYEKGKCAQVTKALDEQCAKLGRKINATKTKLLHVSTKSDDGVFTAGKRIEEVDVFTYLGSVVSKKGGTDEDIK